MRLMRMPNMRIKVFNFFGSIFPYAYFSGLTVDFILLLNLKMTTERRLFMALVFPIVLKSLSEQFRCGENAFEAKSRIIHHWPFYLNRLTSSSWYDKPHIAHVLLFSNKEG